MNIQEAILDLQSRNPHLRIDRLHMGDDTTGYVRVSLRKSETATEAGRHTEAGLVDLRARAVQKGYSGADAEGIACAAKYMEAHLSQNVRLDELSRIAHMSPAKLKYTFSDLMQCTIREYRMVLRIKKACLLLAGTDLTMEEIAAELGYKKPASFINLFRKYMDLHPQEFREIGRRSELRPDGNMRMDEQNREEYR